MRFYCFAHGQETLGFIACLRTGDCPICCLQIPGERAGDCRLALVVQVGLHTKDYLLISFGSTCIVYWQATVETFCQYLYNVLTRDCPLYVLSIPAWPYGEWKLCCLTKAAWLANTMLVILLFGLLTGNCDCSWLITDDCRLSVSNTCLTYEQVTVGQQYLRDSLTRDCQWLHAWGESITRLWAKSSKQSVGQHNFWWMSIVDKSKASIQSKARPDKEWGVSHDTNPPPSKCIPGTTATRFEMIPLSCLLDSDSWLGARQI